MPTVDQIYDEAVHLKDQGKLEEAVAKLQEGLQVDPNHVLTHSALAVHLQKLGRSADAIVHARRVTELEPNDPFSFTQLSVIYQRCGKIPEAEDAMARAHMLSGRGHGH
jgi:Flp pilus assembly protein TadD